MITLTKGAPQYTTKTTTATSIFADTHNGAVSAVAPPSGHKQQAWWALPNFMGGGGADGIENVKWVIANIRKKVRLRNIFAPLGVVGVHKRFLTPTAVAECFCLKASRSAEEAAKQGADPLRHNVAA